MVETPKDRELSVRTLMHSAYALLSVNVEDTNYQIPNLACYQLASHITPGSGSLTGMKGVVIALSHVCTVVYICRSSIKQRKLKTPPLTQNNCPKTIDR